MYHAYLLTMPYPLPVRGFTLTFGLSRILENGISGVGCSQFFASYSACGGDSIMWNVYANRVFGLRFFSDLCSTEPWMSTRSPGVSSAKRKIKRRKIMGYQRD
jgi:hypothetical protein